MGWSGRIATLTVALAFPVGVVGSGAAQASGGIAPAWSQHFPSHSPTGRSGASMAVDPATGQVVLFGGADGNGALPRDTWLWNGTDWARERTLHSPPGRQRATMAADPATGQIVLFGGEDQDGFSRADTWVWTGSDWLREHPAHRPAGRVEGTMGVDPLSGRVVLFGGLDSHGNPLGGTWIWTGSDWSVQRPAHRPPARGGAMMAGDSPTGQLVLFGGFDEPGTTGLASDTWVWNGTDWSRRFPAHHPAPRGSAAMATDPVTGHPVLFGGISCSTTPCYGSYVADTWTWTGTDWAREHPASCPSARENAAMTGDPVTGQLLLYGGDNTNALALGDTWAFTGGSA
jgi:hypothetical protein